MKCAIFSLVVTAVVLGGCMNKREEKKEVPVATEERHVAEFDTIILEGLGRLTLRQGEKPALTLEAPENVIGRIDISVTDKKLTIDTVIPDLPGVDDVRAAITVTDLKKIHLKGAGFVRSTQPIKFDELNLIISGTGKADLVVTGEELDVEITGVGSVVVKGEVEDQSVKISGVGTYDAEDLASKEAKVHVSGAGSAVINAEKALDIEIAGTGRVSYVGTPKITQKISGRGHVEQLEQK